MSWLQNWILCSGSDLPAGGLGDLRLRMFITEDESSLYALPPPDPLHWLLEQLGWILIHWWWHEICEASFSPCGLVSSLLSAIEGKFKGWRVMLFIIRKKIKKKKKKTLLSSYIIRGCCSTTSGSSPQQPISLDLTKSPINNVCLIIFIVGGNQSSA